MERSTNEMCLTAPLISSSEVIKDKPKPESLDT